MMTDQRMHYAHEQSTRWEQGSLAGGTLFTALLLGSAALLPDPPGRHTSSERLADWYMTHRNAFLAQSYLRGLAAVVMPVFVGGIVSIARREQGKVGAPEVLALGGGATFSLVMLMSNMAGATAALVAGRGVEPGTVRALDTLGETMRTLNGFGAALMTGASSVTLLRARAIPRWAGRLGLVSVPMFLVGSAAFPGTRLERLAYVSFPFVPVWPLVTSAALLARSRRAARAQSLTRCENGIDGAPSERCG